MKRRAIIYIGGEGGGCGAYIRNGRDQGTKGGEKTGRLETYATRLAVAWQRAGAKDQEKKKARRATLLSCLQGG